MSISFFFKLFQLLFRISLLISGINNTFVLYFHFFYFSVFTEFQYIDEVINANRFLGPGILLVYFAFVNLILVSMLIAVVEEAFTRAQEDLRTTSETDKLFNSFKNNLISFRRKLGQAGTVRKKIGTC